MQGNVLKHGARAAADGEDAVDAIMDVLLISLGRNNDAWVVKMG